MGKSIGSLPYFSIPTPHGMLNILVDSGSNSNMISPIWAERSIYLPYDTHPEPLKGIGGSCFVSKMIDIPLFAPALKDELQFIIKDFHPFFQGIIGTHVLLHPRVKLSLHEKRMEITGEDGKSFFVPLNFHTPTPTARTHWVNHASISSKIATDHMNEQELKLVSEVLYDLSSVFHDPDNKLTCTTVVQCEINTVDEVPAYQKSYPYPAAYREEVDAQITELLRNGLIRPSRSPWNAPVWVVPKKMDSSGKRKFRLVIDYRALNEKTITERYPMPEITSILDNLDGNMYFSTLDLASGFHQIRMRERDIPKTAFSVNNGKYEWLVCPFGFKNSPICFQKAMDDVLRKHIGKQCYVYMDDIIVFGKTLEEHTQNLREILTTLLDANLKVQLDKSHFLMKEVEFLGYIVTREGIKPNEKKIEVIKDWPVPKNLRQLRGFLGLMGYYRRFIKNFAKIAKPLTSILRGIKGPKTQAPVVLDDNQKSCFETLKNILTSDDVLTYPNFSRPFLVTTDASNFAIGSVLSQGEMGKDKPICFASRTLNRAEENYSACEKEMLSIIWALKVFRNYIYGQRFIILTDHQPLTFSLSSKNTNHRLRRWKSYLEEHDYTILYKPGKSNVVADALSRIEANALTSTQHSAENDDSHYIPTTEAPLNAFRNQVVLELASEDSVQVENPFPGFKRTRFKRKTLNTATLIDVLREGCDLSKTTGFLTTPEIMLQVQEVYKEFFSKSGILRIKYAPTLLKDLKEEEAQLKIVTETHERAHRGIDENRNQILREYYFPGLTAKIREYVKTCDVCNVSKYDRKPLFVEIDQLPLAGSPYEIIHLDIFQIEKKYFLSSLDRFSKHGRMLPIDSRQTVHVAEPFWDALTSFVVPKMVVVDNEAAFKTPAIRGRMIDLGVNIYCTPAHHSESNGPVERFHSTITELYRIQKNLHPTWSCVDLVKTAVEKYNHSIHSVTKMKPIDVVLGGNVRDVTPEKRAEIRQKVYDEVLLRLKEAQVKQASCTKRVPPPELSPGQTVFVKDKLIKAKHKNRFKRFKVQQNNKVTFLDEDGLKKHKENVKNIGLKKVAPPN